MKRTITLFFLIIPLWVGAQLYQREAGIRGGLSSGFTLRQYLHDNLSYEALLSFRQSGMQVSLLRQVHETTLEEYADNLYFVYGYGGHAGYFFTDRYRTSFWSEIHYPYRRFSPLVGIDGYAALEYRFDSLPLSLSFDYKPFFEVSVYQFFRMQLWDFAFAVKYRF